jgi:hypothetical protein
VPVVGCNVLVVICANATLLACRCTRAPLRSSAVAASAKAIVETTTREQKRKEKKKKKKKKKKKETQIFAVSVWTLHRIMDKHGTILPFEHDDSNGFAAKR